MKDDVRKNGITPKLRQQIKNVSVVLEQYRENVRSSVSESSVKEATLQKLTIVQERLASIKSRLIANLLRCKEAIINTKLAESTISRKEKVVEKYNELATSLMERCEETIPEIEKKAVDWSVWAALLSQEKLGAIDFSKQLLEKAKQIDDTRFSASVQSRVLFPMLEKAQHIDSKYLSGKGSAIQAKIQATIAAGR